MLTMTVMHVSTARKIWYGSSVYMKPFESESTLRLGGYPPFQALHTPPDTLSEPNGS